MFKLFAKILLFLATTFVHNAVLVEAKLKYSLPEECKSVLFCKFWSEAGDSLEPGDFANFPNLIAIRDLRPNSTIMDKYKGSFLSKTSSFSIHKIYAGGFVYIRSGMLLYSYIENQVYPNLQPFEFNKKKLKQSLQECVEYHCTENIHSNLLTCHNRLFKNMNLKFNNAVTTTCVYETKYLDLRGTKIGSAHLSSITLNHVYHLNLENVSFQNNQDLLAIVGISPRMKFLRLPDEFGFVEICNVLKERSYFSEIYTFNYIYWPYFNKFFYVYDIRTKCLLDFQIENCLSTARPIVCVEYFSNRFRARVEKSEPTADSYHAFPVSIKRIAVCFLIFVIFLFLTILMYFINREFNVWRMMCTFLQQILTQVHRALTQLRAVRFF